MCLLSIKHSFFRNQAWILPDIGQCLAKSRIRPTLKSCSFTIHRPGEIKNSHQPPAGRNFFLKFFLQSFCLKRYTIKIFKKISSWYNKNVTLYILNIQFLCLTFMLIHRNLIMIDINQSPVLCPHTNKTN